MRAVIILSASIFLFLVVVDVDGTAGATRLATPDLVRERLEEFMKNRAEGVRAGQPGHCSVLFHRLCPSRCGIRCFQRLLYSMPFSQPILFVILRGQRILRTNPYEGEAVKVVYMHKATPVLQQILELVFVSFPVL